jgi:hypothetical protein
MLYIAVIRAIQQNTQPEREIKIFKMFIARNIKILSNNTIISLCLVERAIGEERQAGGRR